MLTSRRRSKRKRVSNLDDSDLLRDLLVADNDAGDDAAVIVGKLLEGKSTTPGFNAQSGEYVDMIKDGIIDPTKVVRLALQDAASVAGLLITTEAMVAEAPKPEKAPAMPAGGGMGDY